MAEIEAKLQKLGVGKFEQADGGVGARIGIEQKSRVPGNDRKIRRIIRHARLQHFIPFAVGEHSSLATNDLRDVLAVLRDHFADSLKSGRRQHVKDVVVLAQPGAIGTDEYRTNRLHFFLNDL